MVHTSTRPAADVHGDSGWTCGPLGWLKLRWTGVYIGVVAISFKLFSVRKQNRIVNSGPATGQGLIQTKLETISTSAVTPVNMMTFWPERSWVGPHPSPFWPQLHTCDVSWPHLVWLWWHHTDKIYTKEAKKSNCFCSSCGKKACIGAQFTMMTHRLTKWKHYQPHCQCYKYPHWWEPIRNEQHSFISFLSLSLVILDPHDWITRQLDNSLTARIMTIWTLKSSRQHV